MEQYSVDYISGGSRSNERIPAPFSEIKEMAKRAVDGGTALRVEVRNSDGQLVFHYPRIVHRA